MVQPLSLLVDPGWMQSGSGLPARSSGASMSTAREGQTCG